MKLIPATTTFAAAIALLLSAVAVAQGQASRGGQGEAVLAPAEHFWNNEPFAANGGYQEDSRIYRWEFGD